MKLDSLKKKKTDFAKFISNETVYVCKSLPKRASASDGEERACNYMADELRKYADNVLVEPFKVNPSAFNGWIYLSVSLLLLSFACYFFSALLSILLMLISFVPFLGEFVFYKKMLDSLYPQKTSQNITAIKSCSGEVKQRILFNGHIDASSELRINYRFGSLAFIFQIVLSFVGILYLLSINIAHWVYADGIGSGIASETYLYIGLVGLVFVPIWLSLYFISNNKMVIDGANDDLSGCFMAISMLKAINDEKVQFEHTEVGVVLTGCKEVGLRGAKAWSEQHKKDFNDVETIIITIDNLHDKKQLAVNHRDLNNLIRCNKDTASLILQSANVVDVKCKLKSVRFGATDAAAFCKSGFKASSLTAKSVKNYHTRLDSYENLNQEFLADCFDISVKALEIFANNFEDCSNDRNDAINAVELNLENENLDSLDNDLNLID